MMGAVSVDVVLALLIGSAAGSHPKLPSVTRMISLAYELGQALGLESNTLAGLEMGDELCQPWWKERYEEMLLVSCSLCPYVRADNAVGGSQMSIQSVRLETHRSGDV